MILLWVNRLHVSHFYAYVFLGIGHQVTCTHDTLILIGVKDYIYYNSHAQHAIIINLSNLESMYVSI